jgi:hypothetical protein
MHSSSHFLTIAQSWAFSARAWDYTRAHIITDRHEWIVTFPKNLRQAERQRSQQLMHVNVQQPSGM